MLLISFAEAQASNQTVILAIDSVGQFGCIQLDIATQQMQE